MNNSPRKSRPAYIPTDNDRARVAAYYDNVYKSPSDPLLSPSDYDVNGATATLRDGGATYFVMTLPEAKESGMSLDTCERIQFLGRAWLISLA
jgi:hypothetical protein